MSSYVFSRWEQLKSHTRDACHNGLEHSETVFNCGLVKQPGDYSYCSQLVVFDVAPQLGKENGRWLEGC